MLNYLAILLYILLGFHACYLLVKQTTKTQNFTYNEVFLFLPCIAFPPIMWLFYFITRNNNILWKKKD
jgi:hypothetical protein